MFGPLPAKRLAHQLASSSRGTTVRPGSILLGHHVKQALANGQPVVALESTVITHGLPEPRNLTLALRLEQEISSGSWWHGNQADGQRVDEPPEASPPSSRSPGDVSVSDRYGADLVSCPTSAGRPPNGPLVCHEHSRLSGGQVVPATVGIIKGQLVVGLTGEQIEFLANKESSRPIKASRRDLALAQACGLSAGTTVSATLALASSVRSSSSWSPDGTANRISVFATGGLGGVHLGGQDSMDVSADLYEMARSPMGIVSSGFKSFLDARRSLEFLETMGCTVVSLAQTRHLYQAAAAAAAATAVPVGPVGAAASGWARKKGHLFPGFFASTNQQRAQSPWRCAGVEEAALILFHCLGPEAGQSSAVSGPPLENQSLPGLGEWFVREARAMLLACPIPAEFSVAEESCAQLTGQIIGRIEARPDLSGPEKTPLILAELARATGGLTLEANLALLRNNARVGAHLAHEYAKLRERGE